MPGPQPAQVEDPVVPDGQAKVYFLDGSWKAFDVTPATTVGELLSDVRARLGIATANAFALYRTGAGFENATPITVLC